MATLLAQLRKQFPQLADPEQWIREGRVLVDGFPVTNPRSEVRHQSHIALREETELRGQRKLEAALQLFDIKVPNKVALDAGAAAGGFVTALLARGAAKVYAVDVGFGQLRGELRLDPRVVNLERTNIAKLDSTLVPEPIDLLTLDLSYLALHQAIPQLSNLVYGANAEMIALVKPMFELGLPTAPLDRASLDRSLNRAATGAADAGWRVKEAVASPHPGANGAVEGFIWAVR